MRNLIPLAALSLLAVACNNGDSSLDTGNIIRDQDLPDAELDPYIQVDHAAQVGVPAVDVLWVVDNSRSMYEEQQSLANNFTSFMKSFEEDAELDYHIAVMSTGYDDETQRGKFRTALDSRDRTIKWIDSTTRDPEVVFRKMALMGIDGPMEEKGRAQVFTALQLKGDTENFGFLRDDAFLSVIVLSDEDDRSGDVPIGFDGFLAWMRNLKPEASQVSFSSFVGPDGGCGNAVEGTQYLALTRALGGIEHSICNSSWANVLEDLGEQAAGLKDEFPLSKLPVPETLEARSRIGRGEWIQYTYGYNLTYDRARNSAIFTDEAPPPGSDIVFEYEVLRSED
jgi:hypothetical protein